MNVLIVVDKINSAIYRCAKAMDNISDMFGQYNIIAVHPKRPTPTELETFRRLAKDADVIDFQYWKTADMLIKSFPFLKDEKKILTHHNPYNVTERNWWDDYQSVYVKNKTQQNTIKEAFGKQVKVIKHTIDLSKFEYQRDYPSEDVFKALMVVARIEGKKGVLEVAEACKRTKTRLILVGRISDPNYMREVIAMAGNYIDFRQDISDEDLVKAYHEAHILINNSTDGFESGTLPHLEAMACGLPVLTRNVGMVPDIFNDKNMIVRPGKKEDVEELVEYIKETKSNRNYRMRMREEAFKTVMSRDDRYTAIDYYREYMNVIHGKNNPLVSVVIPTFNRAETIIATLASVRMQTYKNIEIVVVDDGSTDDTPNKIEDFKTIASIPTKYVRLNRNAYGLARARNVGIVESNGSVIVFLDDRLLMNVNAVEKLLGELKPRMWLFGNKGANKKTFVENFSCAYKRDVVSIGMFNERLNKWGSTTRELLNRMSSNGINTLYVKDALSKAIVGSKSKFTKKKEMIDSRFILWKLWQ